MAADMNVQELSSICIVWFAVHILDIITNYISVMPQVFSLKQCIMGLMVDGIVQMKLEGNSKICLVLFP